MLENSPSPNSNPPALCPEHGQPARWICGKCGRPVCPACKPVAFNYRVFHHPCVELYSEKEEKRKGTLPVDAPSKGVKAIAWFFLVMAIVLVGISLLLLGITLFSRRGMPMVAWLGGMMPTLDDLPGGRSLLGWMSGGTFAAALVHVLVGLGLLNCAQSARIAVLIFSWIQVLVALFGWSIILIAGEGFWDIPVFAVFFIIFFMQRDVKQQFAPSSALIDIPR